VSYVSRCVSSAHQVYLGRASERREVRLVGPQGDTGTHHQSRLPRGGRAPFHMYRPLEACRDAVTDRLIRQVDARLQHARGEPLRDLFTDLTYTVRRVREQARVQPQPLRRPAPLTSPANIRPIRCHNVPATSGACASPRAGLSPHTWNHTKLGASTCRSAESFDQDQAVFRAQAGGQRIEEHGPPGAGSSTD
jgi:hypothetical protein